MRDEVLSEGAIVFLISHGLRHAKRPRLERRIKPRPHDCRQRPRVKPMHNEFPMAWQLLCHRKVSQQVGSTSVDA